MKQKKALPMILALVLIFTLALAACGGTTPPASTTNPPSGPSNTSEPSNEPPAVEYDPVTLRVHHHDNPDTPVDKWFNSWAAEVNELTNGGVTIEIYPNNILGEQKQAYEMTVNGTCDVAWISVAANPGIFPVTEILQLPMLGLKDAVEASSLLMDMWEQTDYLDNDFRDFYVLAVHTTTDTALYFKNETQIDSLADIKGKTIRVVGTWPTKYCTLIGASPISVPAAEVYSSLEKGMMDGCMTDWTFIRGFQTYELCKSYYRTGLMLSPVMVFMNKNSFDNLPEEWQQVILDTTGRKASLAIAEGFMESPDIVINDLLPQFGGTMVEPSEALLAEMTTAAEPLWAEWVGENAANFNSQEVLDWVLDWVGK